MTTDAQFQRLPKHAQTTITHLRARVARLEKEVAASYHRGESDTVAVGGTATPDRPLRHGTRIRFTVDASPIAAANDESWISCHAEHGLVCVRGISGLVTYPDVSNVLWIGLGERSRHHPDLRAARS